MAASPCRPLQQPAPSSAQPAASPVQPSEDTHPLQGLFPEHDFSKAPLELTLEQLKEQFSTWIGLFAWKFTELSPGQSLQDHVRERPEDDPMWPQFEVGCSMIKRWPGVSLLPSLNRTTFPHPGSSPSTGHIPLHIRANSLCIQVQGREGRRTQDGFLVAGWVHHHRYCQQQHTDDPKDILAGEQRWECRHINATVLSRCLTLSFLLPSLPSVREEERL
jgi:hypothetical protein